MNGDFDRFWFWFWFELVRLSLLLVLRYLEPDLSLDCPPDVDPEDGVADLCLCHML